MVPVYIPMPQAKDMRPVLVGVKLTVSDPDGDKTLVISSEGMVKTDAQEYVPLVIRVRLTGWLTLTEKLRG